MKKWVLSLFLLGFVSLLFIPFVLAEADRSYQLVGSERVKEMVVGGYTSAAITDQERLFLWGNNNSYQLFGEEESVRPFPTDVADYLDLNTNEVITSLSLGMSHSLAVTSHNRVLAWGSGSYGELGENEFEYRSEAVNIFYNFALPFGEYIDKVYAGYGFSAALSTSGNVFTWGNNSYGQIGDGSFTFRKVPTNITSQFNLVGGETIIKMDLGHHHAIALSSHGRIFTWGNNIIGQLGDDSTTNRNTPVDITPRFSNLPPSMEGSQVSAGAYHSGLLTSSGDLYIWGSNQYGSIGNASYDHQDTPLNITSYVSLLELEKITFFDLGYDFSLVKTDQNRIFSWGKNSSGELGDYSTIQRNAPADVTSYFDLLTDEIIIQMGTSASSSHSFALTSKGRVLMWGSNYISEIQELTVEYVISPIVIESITIHHTVSFETNGGAAMDSISLIEGYTLLKPDEKPTKIGYDFEDWYSDPELTTLYDFNVMPGEDITLYANWQYAYYYIDYRLDGGLNSHANRNDFNIDTATFTLNAPVKAGHIFNGWFLDADFTVPIVSIPKGTTENVTVYASWTPNYVTFTFHTNGGSDIAPMTGIEGTAFTRPEPPTKAGYTFYGWQTLNQVLFGENFFPAEDTALYAVWTPIQYTITFETNGGTNVSSITRDYNASITAPANPTKVGHTFAGWSQAIPTNMPAENLTITAQWTVNQYTITFNSSGGASVSALTQDYNTSITAPANPTKVGHTFTGWSMPLPSTMPAENLTLIAEWSVNQYTITFDTSGGSLITAMTQDYHSSITTPANPTKTGHTFTGWSSVIPTNMPAENITITAQWSVNQYTITFDSNGGSPISSITQDYNTSIPVPANPTKSGHTFAGWSQALPTNMPAENRTLTAQWTVNQYTITFDSNGGSTIPVITQDYNTSITAPANPTKAGYTFNGWSQVIPSTMPANHVMIEAYWVKVSTEAENLNIEAEDLHSKIDPALTENKDVEITLKVEVKSTETVSESEIELVNQIVLNTLNVKRAGNIYFNIQVLLKEAGLDDVEVDTLLEALTITITIPLEHQGFENYHMIRLHNGVAEVLTTEYDSENQTLTFETDRFSTYVIAYDMGGGFSWWWLLLFLLVPIVYLVFRYRHCLFALGKKKQEDQEDAKPLIETQSEDVEPIRSEVEPTETILHMEEVVVEDIEERERFSAFAEVENGSYLEITPELEASNRVVEVTEGILPKVIHEENAFIQLKQEEVQQFKTISADLGHYHKLTPGSYTDEGYFMEVSLDNEPVDNYVYTKRRLPPTTTKGHRWVKFEPRKVKSESPIEEVKEEKIEPVTEDCPTEAQAEIVLFDEAVIEQIEEREQFPAFAEVDNGNYLEITPDLEASNRVVEVMDGVLPKVIHEENTFIQLHPQEVEQFKTIAVNLVMYQKLTPGSYTDEGYFMEVNPQDEAVDNYVYTKRRLPPTTTKGHRWVKVETRKIKSK